MSICRVVPSIKKHSKIITKIQAEDDIEDSVKKLLVGLLKPLNKKLHIPCVITHLCFLSAKGNEMKEQV